MADKNQLALLKKSVEAWNKWREKNIAACISLSETDLRGADLRAADLNGADLHSAHLSKANLSWASLSGADLRGADLSGADLSGANLIGANLSAAGLREADLGEAHLDGAHLNAAVLSKANLSWADLSEADLSGADLSEAVVGRTSFDIVDLSQVNGLESVKHDLPSSVGIDTIYKSKGNIPEVFLRGCGVPDNFIAFMHSHTGKAFDFYSCFVSHSAKDKVFCERLYADLQAKGVRTWYFPDDAKWGETVWGEIDRSIKIYDKLVVVLSENSLQSKPVLREIQRSLDREGKEHKNILFPITLDRSVFDKWEHERKADVMEKVVGDFSGWDTDAAKYGKAFDKLLKGLQAVSKRA